MMFFLRLRLLSLGLLLGLGSCVTQQKLPYLQSSSYSTQKPVEVANARPAYLLQPGDVLSIRVQSVQPALSEIFNVPGPQSMVSGDPSMLYLTGYPVDEAGTINLPTVGRLKVTGLSLTQAQAMLEQKVGA